MARTARRKPKTRLTNRAILYAVVIVVPAAVFGWWLYTLTQPTPAQGQEIAPLKMRTKLVQTLNMEEVIKSIDKLPHFDDTVWVLGSMGNVLKIEGTYRHARDYIPRLNRVRKILDQGRQDPTAITPHLKDKLSGAVEGFERVYKAKKLELARSKTGITLKAPDENHEKMIFAPAATYLLAELRTRDALPLMVRVYARKERLPVSRVFLFYAMHLLVIDYPRDKLSAQGATRLEDYLRASRHLPHPTTVEVPTWNAAFEETDFRHTILGQEIGLQKQPKVKLRLYPAALDGLEDIAGTLLPEAKTKLPYEELRSFVESAYP